MQHTEFRRYLVLGVVLCGTLVLPHIVGRYWLYLSSETLIMILYAMSYNLVLGYGGLVSFGHAAFYGIGAYTCGLLLVNTEVSISIALLLGACFAGVFAVIIGFVCVRLYQIYFAMVTLAFAQLLYSLALKWRHVTGGDDGISGILRGEVKILPFFALDISSGVQFYYFLLCITLLCIYVLWRISESPLGFIIRSIRENPQRAEASGIDLFYYRLIVFTISAMFTGVAGVMHGALIGLVSPDVMFWARSVDPILMSLLGGMGAFLGPAVGAIVFTLFKDIICRATQNWTLYFGLLLLIPVLFLRGGIMGFVNEKLAPILLETLKFRRLDKSSVE